MLPWLLSALQQRLRTIRYTAATETINLAPRARLTRKQPCNLRDTSLTGIVDAPPCVPLRHALRGPRGAAAGILRAQRPIGHGTLLLFRLFHLLTTSKNGRGQNEILRSGERGSRPSKAQLTAGTKFAQSTSEMVKTFVPSSSTEVDTLTMAAD